MRFIHGLFVALMTTGFFFAPLLVRADICPLRMFKGGGVLAPQSPDDTIRLDSQEVEIRLFQSSYVVDAVFNLMNTGETKTEWVGFPKWVASRLPEYPTFMRFKGSINGSPIEFDEKWDLSGCRPFEERPSAKERERYSAMPLREERQWVASHITFAGHAATTIHVRYEALYYCKGEAFYFMGTGSLWKGNIGKAVFTVYCGAVGGTEDVSIDFEKDPGAVLVPENVQSASSPRVPHTFRFEIVDFKPDREANVRIRVRKMPFMRVFPANRPPEGTPMPFGGPVPLVPLPSHLNTVPVGK